MLQTYCNNVCLAVRDLNTAVPNTCKDLKQGCVCYNTSFIGNIVLGGQVSLDYPGSVRWQHL